MDGKRERAEQYEAQLAYIEQLRRGMTTAVYRPSAPCSLRMDAKLRRPRTWQAIPGVSKLYSLN